MILKYSQHLFKISAGMLLFFLFFSISFFGQTFTDSNLPIVIITTDIDPNTSMPLPIVDDPRILASMKIIQHPDGSRNYLSDSATLDFLNYEGRINIEIRGSSSQDLPKKGYGLTTLQADNVTVNNSGLLGMPSENDWILNPLAFDPSLIRDYLSYNLSRLMGNYATRTVYCEVIINGEYQGLYLFEEKIKADANRVNILKITASDNTAPNVTGGYITKSDKVTGGDPVAWQMASYAGGTDFIHDWPKPETVTAQQNAYIYEQFLSLASTANANNTSINNGFSSLIDIPSFVDFMIINELASNADGYQLSTYFHKDRNGKLRAGPIWDFNLTYGNDLFAYGLDRSKTDVWQFSDGGNEGAKFWTDLFNNPTFKCYLSRRWNELIQPNQPLKQNSLVLFIDNAVSLISEAIVRENQKWGTIPNHALEIENMKMFLFLRTNWLTSHLGSYAACNSIVTPALVIDKINYNPGTSVAFPISNDQEFIEIKNTQSTSVNLTGYYFKELGVTYRFPNNSSMAAYQSIYLASNAVVFQSRYGLVPFGQFTRNLSNKSQKLVLADAFGNTIDTVEYFDTLPWPDADGNGNFLSLISTNLDNNLASSWVAMSSDLLAKESFLASEKVLVFPNPVSDFLNIQGITGAIKIKIYDSFGKMITTLTSGESALKVDFSSFASGIYLLSISDDTGVNIHKIIKR